MTIPSLTGVLCRWIQRQYFLTVSQLYETYHGQIPGSNNPDFNSRD
jgi:hypothetical protein